MFKPNGKLGLFLVAATTCAVSAQAAPSKKAPTPRDVEVDTVKEAYWNRSADGGVEVVQNRQYSKTHRLSILGAFGTVSSDPFLSVQALNAGLSFHFTETFAVAANYRKFLVSDSSYLSELKTGLLTGSPAYANTNRPNAFYGGEVVWSPIYGKISLSGSSIVHYDFHFMGGAGITDTESGKYFTPTFGVGPQFYLSNAFALRLDYRLGIFKETIRESVQVATRTNAGERTNYSHQVALGLEFFL